MSELSVLKKKIVDLESKNEGLHQLVMRLDAELTQAKAQVDEQQLEWMQQQLDGLTSANARLTEDAQRHFDARRAAERNASNCLITEQHWKKRHDEVVEELRALQTRLKALVRMETDLKATQTLMESYQKELCELRAQWVREKELGRDITKPSAVISKRFKHLELE